MKIKSKRALQAAPRIVARRVLGGQPAAVDLAGAARGRALDPDHPVYIRAWRPFRKSSAQEPESSDKSLLAPSGFRRCSSILRSLQVELFHETFNLFPLFENGLQLPFRQSLLAQLRLYFLDGSMPLGFGLGFIGLGRVASPDRCAQHPSENCRVVHGNNLQISEQAFLALSIAPDLICHFD